MFLLACLVAFAAAMDGDQAYVAMRELWFSKSAFVERVLSFKPELNARTFHTLDAASTCVAAEANFFKTAASCLPQVSYIFNGSSAPQSQVASDINTYCVGAGSCNAQLTAAVEELDQACAQSQVWQTQCPLVSTTNCSASNYPCALDPVNNVCRVDPAFLTNLRFVLGLFCLQGPDSSTGLTKFCVPSFYDFVNPLPSCDLATRLANGCDVCTVKIFAMWSQLEPIEAALNFMQLGLECLNLNNTFCSLYVQNMNNQSDCIALKPNGGQCNTFNQSTCGSAIRGCYWNANANPPDCEDSYAGSLGLTKLNTICHPCVGAFIWRSVVILNLEDQFNVPDNGTVPRAQQRIQLLETLFVRSGLCSTDLQDNYCLPQLQSVNANFAPPNTCQALSTVVHQTTCCAASVVAFEMSVCQVELLQGQNTTCVSQIQQFAGVLQSCSSSATPVVLGPTCAQIKFAILVKLVVSGLDLGWYGKAGNPALLLAIVERIIAFNGGVNASAVNAQTSTSRRLLQTGSVGITATVTASSASDYFTVSQGLSKTANLETLDLNQNVPAAGVSPVQLTSSGVNPPTSSATTAVGGVVVALLVAVGVAFA